MIRLTQIKWFIFIVFVVMGLIAFTGCTREKIIIYQPYSEQVSLIYPPDTNPEFTTAPILLWENVADADSYQVQISVNASFSDIVVNAALTDTSYQYSQQLSNDEYFWRVRVQNSDNIWSDWSDALIWSFNINDNSNYMILRATVPTYGIPQDVFVCEELDGVTIAYVADGQAGLTLVDVTDPETPSIIGNLDLESNDNALSVWKVPGDYTAYMADTDGKIACMDVRRPLDPESYRNVNLGGEQNLSDLTGIIFQDTMYLFCVTSLYNHRTLTPLQIVYSDEIPELNGFYAVGSYDLPSDAKGVCTDTISRVIEYYNADSESTYYETQDCILVFVGDTQSGLWWFDVSSTHTFEGEATQLINTEMRLLGSTDTPYSALKLTAKDGFVYVADDRAGLQIFDLPDTIPAFDHDSLYQVDPVLISDVNTSGRTKDTYVANNYCYAADASGGLKIIDITNPYVPVFLAAYNTPYAYGVYVRDEYIYLCDRDNGLMIFEKGDLIE